MHRLHRPSPTNLWQPISSSAHRTILTAAHRTRRWDRPRTAQQCFSFSFFLKAFMNAEEDTRQNVARSVDDFFPLKQYR
jgi:hypothetical protein